MYFALLDGVAGAAAVATPVSVGLLREFRGGEGVSVHLHHPLGFDRIEDGLYESARSGALLACKLLAGEGLVRGQLWVRFDIASHVNVVGESASLLFALALITHKWVRASGSYPTIAATGVVTGQGDIRAVTGIVAKLTALLSALGESPGDVVVLYPRANHAEVAQWLARTKCAATIRFIPADKIEDALEALDIRLLKTFLRNPFRGLESFAYEHRAIFFGRDREIAALVEICLRRERQGCPSVVVIGASGSGKSSLLQAGVMPALAEPALVRHAALRERRVLTDQHRALWRPSMMAVDGRAADESALAASIWTCWTRASGFGAAAAAKMSPTSLDDLLDAQARYWNSSWRFVWLVDQLEELFSPAPILPVQLLGTFGAFLRALRAQGVWILASLRDDFLPQFTRLESLRNAFDGAEGQFYLPVMREASIADVVSQSIRTAGLSLEVDHTTGRSLEAELKEEIRAQPTVLPLIEFTLSELYQRRQGELLTLEAYDAIGGLRGAVTSVAEQVVSQGGFIENGAFTRVFRCLVSVDAHGNVARRRAPAEEFASDKAAQALIDRLVEKRLCVIEAGSGELTYSLAHEALITLWPRVREWLAREQQVLHVRDELQRDAEAWERSSRPRGLLATSMEKIVQIRLVRSAKMAVEPVFAAFLAESEREFRRRQVRRRVTIVSLVMLACVSTVAAVFAGYQRDVAARQRAIALGNEALRALAAGDLRDALALSSDAQLAWHGRKGRTDPNAQYSFLRARLVREVDTVNEQEASAASVLGYTEGSWDGSRIAFLQTDGRALVIDPASHRFRSYAPASGWPIQVLALPHGRVAVFNNNGDLMVYDEKTGAPLPLYVGTEAQPREAWRSPDKSRSSDVQCYAQRCAGLMLEDEGVWRIYFWEALNDRLELSVFDAPGKMILAYFDFVAQGAIAILDDSDDLFVYRVDSMPLRRRETIRFAPVPAAPIPPEIAPRQLPEPAPVLSGVADFEFVDEGTLVAETKNREIVFLDLRTGRKSLAGILPDKTQRLSVPAEGGRVFALLDSGEVFSVDAVTLAPVANLSGSILRVYEIPGTCLVVSVRYDGVVDVVDPCARNTVISWRVSQGIRSATFDPVRHQLYLVTYQGKVQHWDLSTLNPQRSSVGPELPGQIDWPHRHGDEAHSFERLPPDALSKVAWTDAVPLLVDAANDLIVLRDRGRVLIRLRDARYVLAGLSADTRAQRIAGDEIVIHDDTAMVLMRAQGGGAAIEDAIVRHFPRRSRIGDFRRVGGLLLGRADEHVLLFDPNLSASAVLDVAIPATVSVTDAYLLEGMRAVVLELDDCTTRMVHVTTGKMLSTITRTCGPARRPENPPEPETHP